MRNKKIVIGIIVIVAFVAFILIIKSMVSKSPAKKGVASSQAKALPGKAQPKKVITKGKGGLTVRMLNSKNAEVPLKFRAFKVIDKKSSVYMASSVGGRMQEVLPGTYDIEIDTIPQKILKNIKVSEGKETIEDAGCVTGSLNVKAVTGKKNAAFYPIRILYPKTNDMITAYMTNKDLELVPGVYDIEIGVTPRVYKKDVKVEAGKDSVIDLGCIAGTLLVRVVDENQKNVRAGVRIMNPVNNEVISSGTSNKVIELGKGVYNIEILSTPRQNKNDVKINTGEETAIEFIVKAPPAPAPAKPAAGKSSKTR